MKNKELLKKLLIMLGVIIILFIIVFIGISIYRKSNSKFSYEKIKKDMVSASKEYYSSLEVKLNSGEVIYITDSELIKKGYLKDYSKKLEKGVKCSGKVTITNNFDQILYTPNLDCGSAYKDITLAEKLKMDDESRENNDGLYEMFGNLVYRGEKVNNYLIFAGKSWSILRINSDGSIRAILNQNVGDSVVWDDRYNTQSGKNYGINNFEKSRIRDYIDDLSNGTEILNDSKKAYIRPHDICIGKRSIYDSNLDYSIECSEVINNQMFSLIQVNEYLIPSLDLSCSLISDRQCTNYNYLYSRFSSSFMWTTTINTGSTYYAFAINGLPKVYYTNTKAYIYPVIELSPEAIYSSGDGSYKNPYKIVEG